MYLTPQPAVDDARRGWHPFIPVALVGLALVLVFSRNHGWYVGDNRFDLYWNPQVGLRDNFSAWSSARDLGILQTGFHPVPYAYVRLLRALGASAWVSERLFHATLLSLGAIGAARLSTTFGARTNLAPLVAGVWFVVAPFTVGFLFPSWLYMNVALAPWFFLAAYKGITTPSRWRWAAVFALGMLTVGSLNPPGLAYALVPLVPLIAYLLLADEADARAVVSWLARAAALTILVLVPAVLATRSAADLLSRNVTLTESAIAVSGSSSWPESLRGLGGWLLYFNLGGAAIGYVRYLFANPVAVVLTFCPPVAAVLVVGRSGWRPRILFGSVLLMSAWLMVGAFPFGAPPPAGRLLLDLYDAVPSAFAFRSTYKAGAGLLFATSVLVGWFAEQLWTQHRTPLARRSLVITLVLIAVVCSSAFWGGGIYGPSMARTSEIPGYWREAADWLEAQPGTSRAIVIPAVREPRYTWGAPVAGDIFPSILDRPFVMEEPLSNGPPDANDLVLELSSDLSSGEVDAAALAPVARRLGIEYVVIRNDLDWRGLDIQPPSAFDGLREGGLFEATTFGDPGENTLGGDPSGGVARRPVEILRIPRVTEAPRLVGADGSLIVSGNGAAWLPLGRDGGLDGGVPIEYSGRLHDEELVESLEAGGSVVLTDTNRRRPASLYPTREVTLAATQPGSDLFLAPETQSVATYGVAKDIVEVQTARLRSPGAEHRPAAAFDGDRDTTWLTGGGLPFQPQGLEVRFEHPERIGEVMVRSADATTAGRDVLSVDVVFPDGDAAPITVKDGVGRASFPARDVSSIAIVITSVTAGGASFGLSEVQLADLDVREAIRLPTDVMDAAARDADVARLVASADLSIRLEREASQNAAVEAQMHREFRLHGARVMDGSGALTLPATTSDELLAELIGAEVTALANGPSDRSLDDSAPLTTDGHLDTGWLSAPDADSLDLQFPLRPLSQVVVVYEGSTPPTGSLSVSVGDERSSVSLAASSCDTSTRRCTVAVPVDTDADQLQLAFSSGSRLVRVMEVQLDGAPNRVIDELPTVCTTELVEIDGAPLPVELAGTLDDLLAGEMVATSTCGPVSLPAGDHRLSGTGAVLERFELRSGTPRATPAPEGTVQVHQRSDTELRLEASAPDGGRLVSGLAQAPGWTATIGGRSVGEGTTLDGQSAWALPAGKTTEVTIRYEPDAPYTWSIRVAAAAALLCLVLVLWNPQARVHRRVPDRVRPVLDRVVIVTASGGFALFCWLAGGVVGGVVALGALVVIHRRWIGGEALATGAAVLLAIAVALYFAPFGPGLGEPGLGWVASRQLANAAGRTAGLLLAAAILAGALAHLRQRLEATPPG